MFQNNINDPNFPLTIHKYIITIISFKSLNDYNDVKIIYNLYINEI